MKKVMMAILATAILALAGCNKDKIGDYSFMTMYTSNMVGTDRQEVFDHLLENFKEIDYFSKTHSYHGLFYEVCDTAFLDFAKACENVEPSSVLDSLIDEESLAAVLVCADSGLIIGTYLWKHDEE